MILEDLQKQNEELEVSKDVESKCVTPALNGFVSPQNKNTHLNQAIHEEQEAILELRVQLRLLQSHKQQQEVTMQLPAEQAPPTQPSPEPRSEEQAKRSVVPVAPPTDTPTLTNGKTAKDPGKPSPNKDRRDTSM